MMEYTKRPIVKNIRTFLTEGFTDRELRQLCYDVSNFRPVYNQLAENTGKEEIVHHLIEYAEQKILIETLLNEAKERNPARYEKHQPYYEGITSPITSGGTHGKSQGVGDEDLDVPRFDFFREILPTKTIYTKGIQFTDKDPENPSDPPKLYLSVYFKDSQYFVGYPLSTNEKWLYLEANMRPALNLRVQVRAWNMRDVDELMNFLRNDRDGWDLHGPRPADDQAGDYFYVWRENGENRLMISTFTPTNAGISIHARFSNDVAQAFSEYLEEVGFTKSFKE